MIKLNNYPPLKIEVDNRLLDQNSLFIAIVGKRFNPLQHLDTVIQSGCRYVVCEKQYEELTKDFSDKINFIFVEDIVEEIQELGRKVASQFQENGGKIIAISGSNGKTTTKEMLFYLLAKEFPEEVICTQKNNNNHLGVPFSLFQINEKTKFAIIELGSNHPGEIETLCKIANPNLGVTTNIGATHLEFFHSLENVFIEESALGHYADSFFVNSDDEFLKEFSSEKKLLFFGESGKDFKFEYLGKNSISVNEIKLQNDKITGKHNFINLGLAFSLASFLMPNRILKFKESASGFSPTANRSQWLEWKDTQVFLDAYNANPSSMKAAIEGFIAQVQDTEENLLILGDMNELGDTAAQFHVEMGEYLRRSYPKSQKIFIGLRSQEYAKGYGASCSSFSSVQEASEHIQAIMHKVRFLFIKGSRSLQLESILDI